MSEQRYTWYPETDKSPCYIDWYPVGLQLAPAWFRADVAKGSATYDWGRDDIPPTKVYRDDLRGGWHVVPSGVRFVAVQGIKAGQWCYSPIAASPAANRRWRRWILGPAMEQFFRGSMSPERHGGVKEDDRPDAWCILDLHDLADHRKPTGASRPADSITVTLGDGFASSSPREVARKARQGAPRFIVRAAAEMREGEPYIDAGDYPYEQWNSDDIDHATNDPEIWHYNQREDAAWVTFLVDTHSPTWQAFDREHRTAKNVSTLKEGWKTCGPVVWSPEPVLPEVAKPSGHHWHHDGHFYRCTCKVMCSNPPRNLSETACEIAWNLYAADRAMPTPAPEPAGPTDAEIVEAWDRWLDTWERILDRMHRGEGGFTPEGVREMRPEVSTVKDSTWAEYQAARSRELAKRQREAREQERQRIVCEGTLPEDY